MTRARETSENARLAKAWVNFNGAFGTSPFTEANGGIRKALNVSTITDYGTGDYGVNFSEAFSSGNSYTACVTVSAEWGTYAIPVVHQGGVSTLNTGSLFRFRISEGNSYVTQRDSANIYVIIFGD